MGQKVLGDDSVFYSFDPSNKPALYAEPGDEVLIHTKDCFSNQIKSEQQLVSSIDFSKVNPATGPVYLRGASPGDALVAEILSIETAEEGLIVTVPGAGALGNQVKLSLTRKCRVKGNSVEFSGVEVPARKMIGVIGVATSEKLPNGVPGRHGGNLDTRLITEGSKVYLPVEYEGALFGLGDLHAAMGDGEVCVAGCEVSGKVKVRLGLVKGLKLPWPLVETEEAFYFLVSHEDLSKAIETAVSLAVDVLSKSLNMEWHESYMLASMAIDMEISQVVDPRKTVRARIPKSVLSFEKLFGALGGANA